MPEWRAVLDAVQRLEHVGAGPVEFLVPWDDERVPRVQSLALFDALTSAEKTMHADFGKHGEIPALPLESTLRFSARHLG